MNDVEEVTAPPRLNVDFFIIADEAYCESAPGTKLGAKILVKSTPVELPNWGDRGLIVDICATMKAGHTQQLWSMELPKRFIAGMLTVFKRSKR